MKAKFLLVITLLFYMQLFPQQYLEKQLTGYNPNEIVTLSSTLSFNQAIELLSKVSENISGKSIVSTVSLEEPVGFQIDNMPYQKALVVLVQLKGLMFEEKEDVIVVKRKFEPSVKERTEDTYAAVGEREVKISALFFEMDLNESKQRGIDWKFLLSGKNIDIGGKIGIDRDQQSGGTGGTGTTTQTPEAELNTKFNFEAGNFFGEATAVFKFFENENLGEIIGSPYVTVRDRKEARLQVGSDISIKQRDFAGNVIENFYSTGTIMGVTPFVYKEDGLDYILLNIKVERSSFVPDEITTIINKTEAQTQVMMLNGEETVIGGLFINEDTKIRNGVPILKDLPWWVFGLRYIFGSDQTIVTKKELVILIKTELVPTLKERLAWPQSGTPLQDEVKKQRERLKLYQLNQSPTKEN